jgi:hypothetical protein
VLFNLTLCEARLGSQTRAAELLARLERRADPELVERARESLLRLEVQRAERLLRDGRTGDAVEILSRVLSQTGDRDLATALAARLEQIERAQAGGS